MTSEVTGQTPYILDTQALVNNDWSRLFINGIDGHQPLLEALESGVDGKGSQPLLELLNDERALLWLRNTTLCAAGKMKLRAKHYPDFGIIPNNPPKALDDSYIAAETIGGIIAGLQQIDYQHLKRDSTNTWKRLQEAKDKKDSDSYWQILSAWMATDVLDPFMTCSGYPGFSEGRRRRLLDLLRDSNHRRRLITIGETGLKDAFYDFMGVGSRDFVTTTKEMIHRLQTCDNRACHWIGGKHAKSIKLGQDAFTAMMAVINILGALFFMVANLGFSSYDALLTFPQERVLFNRESANGLYRTSSYFLAKNLADLPFQLIPSFVLVTIYYLFVGLGTTFAQYVLYIVICAGMTFAAYGFGYFISAASPRMEVAVLIAPVVLVIWLTIAGFFLRDEQIPKWIGWLSFISFYRWGFFSLVTNQFPPGKSFGLLSNHIPLLMSGITETRLWATILILFSLGFGYRLAAYFALKYTNRSVGIQS